MVKTVTEEVFLSAVNFANAFYVLVLQNPDLSFFENHVDPATWLLTRTSDQDPHCFSAQIVKVPCFQLECCRLTG